MYTTHIKNRLSYYLHGDTILKYAIPYFSRKIQDLRLTKSDLINQISGYNYYVDKLSSDIVDYVNILSKTMKKVPYQPPNIDKFTGSYTLKTSQLISYLFKHEVDKKDPFQTFKKASTYKETPSKLQITEIAINEGTTKDFVSATQTELTQNSVDAIRSSEATNKTININFSIDERGTSETSAGGKYYLMVKDFVGINNYRRQYNLHIIFNKGTASQAVIHR